jgi:glycosyltransferase involved in cell wall biosynthesis
VSKILLISPWAPPPDGVAFHSLALVTSWQDAGHEVLVVTSGSENALVLNLASPNGQKIRAIRTLRLAPRRATTQLLSDFQPDIVIVQFAIASQSTTLLSTLRLMSAAFQSGLPVVVAFHEPAREIDRLGPLSRWIYRTAARFTTHPVVYSPAGATALRSARIFADVAEVPLGCPLATEVSSDDLIRVRRRYTITAPLVLTLGFTHPDKGTDLLVSSIPDVTRLLDGNVQFLIAGSPRARRGVFRLMGRSDRTFHRDLTRRANDLTAASIEVCSFVPNEDISALLFLASAVVLPYRRSTQSSVANEALGARAVIVASDIPELRSDLGNAARYFHSESISNLTETLVSVLNSSQDELRDAAAARATGRSYDATAAKLLDIGNFGSTSSQ